MPEAGRLRRLSPWWLLLPAFVGFNLIQSVFTVEYGYSKAGLTDGDLITGLNGEELSSVAGSIGKLPGGGGTSCGEPGPVGADPGGGLRFDIAAASLAVYRPSAFAFSAS